MRASLLAGLLVGFLGSGLSPALACDGDSGNTFILKSPDGTTNMMGSLDDLKSMKRALGSERRYVLWARVDGREYVVTDPTVLARARAIFERADGLDAKQEVLEKQLEALEETESEKSHAIEREEERLDQLQDELDAEQDRVSDAMEHDLDTLVRQAIEDGKAAKP